MIDRWECPVSWVFQKLLWVWLSYHIPAAELIIGMISILTWQYSLRALESCTIADEMKIESPKLYVWFATDDKEGWILCTCGIFRIRYAPCPWNRKRQALVWVGRGGLRQRHYLALRQNTIIFGMIDQALRTVVGKYFCGNPSYNSIIRYIAYYDWIRPYDNVITHLYIAKNAGSRPDKNIISYGRKPFAWSALAFSDCTSVIYVYILANLNTMSNTATESMPYIKTAPYLISRGKIS